MKYKGWSTKNGRTLKGILGPGYFVFLILLLLIFRNAYEPEAPQLPQALSPPRLYSNQANDQLQKVVKEAISQAKESIVCMIYSLNDDAVIAALKKKAEEGIRVVVVHDPVATLDAQAKLGPHIQTTPFHRKGLMHNKLLSIDHKQAWLGSANFTRDSLTTHANLMLGIESPQIAQAIEQKASGQKIKNPLVISHQGQEIEVRFLPDDPMALNRVLSVLQSAKKTIQVAMFTFTHPQLIDAIVQAHKRGVKVEVVLDNDSSRKTSKTAYKCFLKEGVDVRTSDRQGLLHEKIAIIDEKLLICGSANWTKAAFGSNDETLVLLHPLTQEQKEKLSTFWNTTIKESKNPLRRKTA